MLTYICLLGAIVLGWLSRRSLSLVAIALTLAIGLWTKRLDLIGLASLLILVISAGLVRKYKVSWIVLLTVTAGLYNYLFPGFQNLAIFKDMHFAPDSTPFTMYLNLDKTVAGLILYLFCIKPTQAAKFSLRDLKITAATWLALVVLLLPLALLIQYVRWDLKWPELGWLWMLNNLFFVCLAEEALFRGVIQGELTRKIGAVASILVAALLFGLYHYRGGVAYMALAAVAGLFYGFAFYKTKRLESAMMVHFGLNLVHFLAFSYPALLKVPS